MPTYPLRVRTDEYGRFHKTEKVNPPGWWEMTVELRAQLLEPSGTCVHGTLDIDAVDGDPSNNEKSFKVCHGQTMPLGQWRVDGGDNIVVARGRTKPSRPNTWIRVELQARVV